MGTEDVGHCSWGEVGYETFVLTRQGGGCKV